MTRFSIALVCVLLACPTFAAEPALDEVNKARAARGLPPFVEDPALTEAAKKLADYRAKHLMFGHTTNDFAFGPGTGMTAAGCAAYPASYGWMSCCAYDNYQYAGAAFTVGADGKRYMHLCVRSGNRVIGGYATTTQTWSSGPDGTYRSSSRTVYRRGLLWRRW